MSGLDKDRDSDFWLTPMPLTRPVQLLQGRARCIRERAPLAKGRLAAITARRNRRLFNRLCRSAARAIGVYDNCCCLYVGRERKQKKKTVLAVKKRSEGY
ncbi:hypothetical protein EVAR_29450_1 [Eumeta japonica]|uniref:Uncharacterized protein n=1 Tax=Eumeta variegata TaxID=151549 RepID=A0A4C1VW21_EUMVA|nr:hypothetical protein EVAR_29450_1 [Eumeta japonica]